MKFKDYRGLEFPAFLRELGFADNSWHNDAAACAAIECVGDEDGWCWVFVWVTEDDPAEREFPEAKKFAVMKGHTEDLGDAETVLDTDDAIECSRFCAELVAKLGGKAAEEEVVQRNVPLVLQVAGAGPPAPHRTSELRHAFGVVARELPGRYTALETALSSQPADVQREFWRMVQQFEQMLTQLKRKVREPWRR